MKEHEMKIKLILEHMVYDQYQGRYELGENLKAPVFMLIASLKRQMVAYYTYRCFRIRSS